jgi:hypothetical protein
MKFARVVFLIAGLYGLVILAPGYFLEQAVGRDNPPAITHPEFFYGFLGVALAWQIAFLIIAQNPVRFRPVMIPSIIEKLTYSGAVIVLLKQHRVSMSMFELGLADLVFAVLFAVSFVKTRRSALESSSTV